MEPYAEAVDHDSLGLFQQRPSMGWGTPAQITDPIHATNAFLNAMLREYPNNAWMSGDIGAICQRVQTSEYPSKYDHEVHDAQLLVGALWQGLSVGPLHEVYGDSSGWHGGNTGIQIQGLSAVVMGGQHAQVMAIKDGYLHQIYGDDSGWHDGNTGIPAKAVSAVNMGGQWPRVMTIA